MTQANDGQKMACKPLLQDTAEVLAGYITLHEQEAKYTAKALREVPDGIAVWYRLITLYDRTHRGEHESPFDDNDDQHKAWHLRLRLSGVALSTSKLALDATLAGYYSQAYGLLRHMLETWQQLVYVRFNAGAAQQWFSPDGKREPVLPAMSTIVNRVRKYAKQDEELKHNAPTVESQIVDLHAGAHPSAMTVAQSTSDYPDKTTLGAKFNREYLINVISKGTVATSLLLQEIKHSIPIDDDWQAEFTSILEAYRAWFESVH